MSTQWNDRRGERDSRKRLRSNKPTWADRADAWIEYHLEGNGGSFIELVGVGVALFSLLYVAWHAVKWIT